MPVKKQPPVIGISSGASSISGSLTAITDQIHAADGIPVVLHNIRHLKECCDTLAGLDALILMGNYDDIDPGCYGQPVHPATKVETDVERRKFEEKAIELALAQKMPLMGICGGMQRINTLNHHMNGGTLIQHVPDRVLHDRHSQQEIPSFMAVQEIVIEPYTLLADIAGLPVYRENSFHHQAIDVVHNEFRVCAYAEDGVIEAIEPRADGRYAEQFVLGVQWHPEFNASDLGAKLAARLIAEARLFSLSKKG